MTVISLTHLTTLIVFIGLLLINRHLLPKFWWLAQLLLVLSPWFIQLLYSPIELNWLLQPNFSIPQIFHNLSIYSSDDYVFFTGDKRLEYGTQEAGMVYLSFTPLWLIGLLQAVGNPRYRWLALWLGGGVLASSLFAQAPIFSASLLYIPSVQILVGLGAGHLIKNFSRYHLALRLGLVLLFAFVGYEMINFIHNLIVHYPQRLDIEGINLRIL